MVMRFCVPVCEPPAPFAQPYWVMFTWFAEAGSAPKPSIAAMAVAVTVAKKFLRVICRRLLGLSRGPITRVSFPRDGFYGAVMESDLKPAFRVGSSARPSERGA